VIPASNTLSALEKPLEGLLTGPDATFYGVSTDTRALRPGDVYLALRGERFDGNAFIGQAAGKGAAGAIVEEPDDSVDLGQLRVRDGGEALARLGRLSRDASGAVFLAITGSQGKTTVKEMAGAICRARADTLVTRGNLNNAIGVPLTLLELQESHRFAVIELGANAVGEIAGTVALVRPDVALINNAAATHVEGFGSLEGVIEGKGEIIDGLGLNGTMVLNADDPAFDRWRRRAAGRRVTTFSISDAGADFHASDVRNGASGSRFVLRTPDQELPVELALPGLHNVANALAAAALGHAAGIDARTIARALSTVTPVSGRLKPGRGCGGSILLDDSYNASPSSFRAAVDVLMAMARESAGRAIVVTGVMAELGEDACAQHREAGQYARKSGVSALWALGSHGDDWCDGFGAGALAFDTHEQVIAHARRTLDRNCVVLVKGSRSAAMDRVVNALQITEDSH